MLIASIWLMPCAPLVILTGAFQIVQKDAD